jgi:F420-0:gamma-glutamyl ligase-like protein
VTSVKRRETLAIATAYWKPGQDYVDSVVSVLEDRLCGGDVVVISEKAVSTASGNVVDESLVRPSWTARFLARFWVRRVWAYVLGPLCHLRRTMISNLRSYPVREGSAHKQVALQYSGFLQALMHGSEGGIDGSNLPYSYVSLPLENAFRAAETVRKAIEARLGEKVLVMIVDTDKTYSWRNFHFTPRPKPVRGIKPLRGVVPFVVGRFFKLKKRATPLAVAGAEISVERALEIAETANRARGFGAGRNVWDMARTFGVPLTAVSWEMLEKIEHKPIVVVRLEGQAAGMGRKLSCENASSQSQYSEMAI